MKFDINDYKGKYVMHCKTEEETREFCDYIERFGIHYLASKTFRDFNANTCYNFNFGRYSDKDYYESNGYTVLEWSDFTTEFTKSDLKNGMIVEYENGCKRMVLNGNLLGLEIGHMSLDCFDDDLKSTYDTKLNINKVYVCNTNDPSGLTDLFDNDNLALIWEREEEKPEPVEMTLEEICAALGKEIKIVKG